jgi:glycosyltransferase involved in cell wall biosynthesis
MAMGLPCVASAAATAGTAVADGDGILAADDRDEFAEHIVRLLRDAAFRARVAGKARAAAELNYRWETQLARLDRVVAALSPQPASSTPLEPA